MTQHDYRVSVIGGEAARGGLIRGTSTARVTLTVGLITAGAGLSPFVGQWSLLGGFAAAGIVWLTFARTGVDSIAQRFTKRIRWWVRRWLGYDELIPYTEDAWATRKGRARRRLRVRPDGADGMMWLQDAPETPGIAWHEVPGQASYLSVAFEVEGSVRGLGGPSETEAGAIAWGQFLGTFGSSESLATRVQTLTRVLPPELAEHRRWVFNNADSTAPRVIAESYRDALDIIDSTGMVQRHFVVICWPLTPRFYDAASVYGRGPDAWLSLMHDEIAAKRRALVRARLGHVRALTARQVAAFILHTQDPDRPLDRVVDIDPEQFAAPSKDRWGSTVTTGADAKFHHATALIESSDVAVTQRGPYWTTPWLTGIPGAGARTIAFHMVVVPAVDARHRVDQEYQDALVDLRSAERRGRTLPRAAQAALESAETRMADLTAGSQNHGVEWVMYITVTAPTARELTHRKRIVQERAQTDMAIARLNWLDSYHSAALGATWPLGRGIKARGSGAAAMRDSLSRIGRGKGDADDD